MDFTNLALQRVGQVGGALQGSNTAYRVGTDRNPIVTPEYETARPGEPETNLTQPTGIEVDTSTPEPTTGANWGSDGIPFMLGGMNTLIGKPNNMVEYNKWLSDKEGYMNSLSPQQRKAMLDAGAAYGREMGR